MKLIFNTYRSNEHAEGCYYAIVDVTLALRQSILDRVALFESLREKDNSLTTMEYWSAAAEFLDGIPEDAEPDYETEWSPFLADDDLTDYLARTECDRMVITNGEVYWEAIPKHCDWRVETRPISVKDLQALELEEVTA